MGNKGVGGVGKGSRGSCGCDLGGGRKEYSGRRSGKNWSNGTYLQRSPETWQLIVLEQDVSLVTKAR